MGEIHSKQQVHIAKQHGILPGHPFVVSLTVWGSLALGLFLHASPLRTLLQSMWSASVSPTTDVRHHAHTVRNLSFAMGTMILRILAPVPIIALIMYVLFLSLRTRDEGSFHRHNDDQSHRESLVGLALQRTVRTVIAMVVAIIVVIDLFTHRAELVLTAQRTGVSAFFAVEKYLSDRLFYIGMFAVVLAITETLLAYQRYKNFVQVPVEQARREAKEDNIHPLWKPNLFGFAPSSTNNILGIYGENVSVILTKVDGSHQWRIVAKSYASHGLQIQSLAKRLGITTIHNHTLAESLAKRTVDTYVKIDFNPENFQ